MSLAFAIRLPVFFVEFQPHCVQDRKTRGQTNTQNPTEIPHVAILRIHMRSIATRTLEQFLEIDLASQHPINPGCIEQDDR